MQKIQLYKLLILLSIPFQSFLQLDEIQLKEIMMLPYEAYTSHLIEKRNQED